MSHKNSFRLLWEAIKTSRQSMWVSVQVLIVITVVLSVILYLAEQAAQPEDFDFWKSVAWSFTRYIEDPAEVAETAPVTAIGKVVGSIIGVIGILLFAVPAGIIGGAFNNAIDEDIHKKELHEMGQRLQKAFRRKQDAKTMFKCVPRYITLGTLQARKNMTQNEIVDAVEYNPCFRLRNLATAEANGTHAIDQLAVEMFPQNTVYGCCIDRGSDITIVCPTSVTEAGIGNFAYYLALIGGFNYVSKEIEPDIDEQTSFYLISDETTPEQRAEYLADLKRLSKGKNRWTIFLISAETRKDASLHFVTKANSAVGRDSTVIDDEAFSRVWDMASQKLEEEFGLKSDCDVYKPVGNRNVAVKIGGGIDTNAFTIRIFSEILVWDNRYMAIAKTMAESLALTFGKSSAEKMTPKEVMKESGYGYQGMDVNKQ